MAERRCTAAAGLHFEAKAGKQLEASKQAGKNIAQDTPAKNDVCIVGMTTYEFATENLRTQVRLASALAMRITRTMPRCIPHAPRCKPLELGAGEGRSSGTNNESYGGTWK